MGCNRYVSTCYGWGWDAGLMRQYQSEYCTIQSQLCRKLTGLVHDWGRNDKHRHLVLGDNRIPKNVVAGKYSIELGEIDEAAPT